VHKLNDLRRSLTSRGEPTAVRAGLGQQEPVAGVCGRAGSRASRGSGLPVQRLPFHPMIS